MVWVCRVCSGGGGGGVWHLRVNDDEREVLEGQHDVIFLGFGHGPAESSRAAADCRLLHLSVSSLVKKYPSSLHSEQVERHFSD